MFEGRLEGMQSSGNANELIKREQDNIRDKIATLQAEIAQYEHNLGFFSKSSKSSSMVKDIYDKINAHREEVKDLRQQLNSLHNKEPIRLLQNKFKKKLRQKIRNK